MQFVFPFNQLAKLILADKTERAVSKLADIKVRYEAIEQKLRWLEQKIKEMPYGEETWERWQYDLSQNPYFPKAKPRPDQFNELEGLIRSCEIEKALSRMANICFVECAMEQKLWWLQENVRCMPNGIDIWKSWHDGENRSWFYGVTQPLQKKC